LSSDRYQQTDDTTTRVNGVYQHCPVVCNPLYTAYFTLDKKDRLTVLDVLRNGAPRVSRLNAPAYAWLEPFGLSASSVAKLQALPQDQDLSEAEFTRGLAEQLPLLGPQQRKHILEAAALA